jgi:hypothetical protein
MNVYGELSGGGSLGGRGKERRVRGEEDRSTPHTSIWRQHNETHQHCLKRRRRLGNGNTMEGWLVPSTLYTCMKLSQWSPLVLVMYAKSKIKFKKRDLSCTHLCNGCPSPTVPTRTLLLPLNLLKLSTYIFVLLTVFEDFPSTRHWHSLL